MVCVIWFLSYHVWEIIRHVEGDFFACGIYSKSILLLYVACYLFKLFFDDCFRSTEVEQSILEDLRNRVQLSSSALPSVSFYTLLNAHNG